MSRVPTTRRALATATLVAGLVLAPSAAGVASADDAYIAPPRSGSAEAIAHTLRDLPEPIRWFLEGFVSSVDFVTGMLVD